MMAGGQRTCLSGYPLHTFNAAVRSLERKWLIRCVYSEDGNVDDTMLTQDGYLYMAENPKLRNPVNWGMLATIIAALSSAVSIIALLVACNKI